MNVVNNNVISATAISQGNEFIVSRIKRKKKLMPGNIVLVRFLALALFLVAAAAVAYMKYVYHTGEIVRDIYTPKSYVLKKRRRSYPYTRGTPPTGFHPYIYN